MLAQLQKNIQALRAGKLAIIFAVGFFGFGEIAKFSDRFLHAISYYFQRIFRMKAMRTSRFCFCFPAQSDIPSCFHE
jgi:hypothetical protein